VELEEATAGCGHEDSAIELVARLKVRILHQCFWEIDAKSVNVYVEKLGITRDDLCVEPRQWLQLRTIDGKNTWLVVS
jgi:hypothetical protein